MRAHTINVNNFKSFIQLPRRQARDSRANATGGEWGYCREKLNNRLKFEFPFGTSQPRCFGRRRETAID